MPQWPKRPRGPGQEVAATQSPAGSRTEAIVAERRQPCKPIVRGSNAEEVGPISETKEEHLLRHGGGRRTCPRCRWYKFGPGWMKQHGGVREARVAGPRDLVWVAERPTKWGGKWAPGCVVCAAARVFMARGPVRFTSKPEVGSLHFRGYLVSTFFA